VEIDTIGRLHPEGVIHHGDACDIDALTALFDAVDKWIVGDVARD
jgi:hypothetical protein